MSDGQLEDALDTISLLSAMYPLPTEFELTSETANFVAQPNGPAPDQLEMTLRLSLEDGDDKSLEVYIALPTNIGSPKLVPRQPDWLSRGEHETLLAAVPPYEEGEWTSSSEYILTTLEIVKESCDTLLATQLAESSSSSAKRGAEGLELMPDNLQRVWFWFPTLSTKEKRRDLVEYAPRYGLTGFVLAGKPALLCLEGDGRQVDKYMSAIKSESWADIPSFQKKVTERLRKPLSDPSERKFNTMTEITHLIPTYGQYNHRGDMSEVRRLMDSWGVGEDFGSVVLNMTT